MTLTVNDVKTGTGYAIQERDFGSADGYTTLVFVDFGSEEEAKYVMQQDGLSGRVLKITMEYV